MFTGIIESIGRVEEIQRSGGNLIFTISSGISSELKVDQSLSHNGVCLTVIWKDAHSHKVEAIDETLTKSNIGDLKVGDLVNLERSMIMSGRLDGHIVQGHVDLVGVCVEKKQKDGSWEFVIQHPKGEFFTVEKGSICVNGVSLTVVNSKNDGFAVAIIPYTYEHTNFKNIVEGSTVNLEFDIIGKYVARLIERK